MAIQEVIPQHLHDPQNVKEGTIFISPSYLHYVHPNQVRKHRTIISFDLLPKLPDHQSRLNI